MKWSGVCLLASLAALCLLQGRATNAAPSPRTDDLLKTLQDLEQMYSSMARPSVRSGSALEPEMSKKVQRAMKMIEMQRLERMYAHRARPRFGKRDRLISNNALYRNGETDYADDQSNDDGHVLDAEMRPVSDRDDASRQRQLQRLQHFYHYQLN